MCYKLALKKQDPVCLLRLVQNFIWMASVAADCSDFFLGKCFSKLSFSVTEEKVKGAIACKPGFIEKILGGLRDHVSLVLVVFKN